MNETTQIQKSNETTVVPSLPGLHHVTAFASDPQRNVDFYAGTLGLRLVKVTVNFDAPGTYHFYYGDGSGNPGSVITFFPWPNAYRGAIGDGQAVATAFDVPEGSLEFWQARLGAGETETRLGQRLLRVEDPDGLRLELIESEGSRKGWADGPVPEEHAIRGFHSVTLQVAREETGTLLTDGLGWTETEGERDRRRFRGAGDHAAIIDLVPATGSRGLDGVGTVHHVAFRTPDDESQAAWLKSLREKGINATPVQDRQYFHSIYFREPSGVLYEIATDVPGFDADEPLESLGTTFRLPSWLEPHREKIERAVPPIRTPQGVQLP